MTDQRAREVEHARGIVDRLAGLKVSRCPSANVEALAEHDSADLAHEIVWARAESTIARHEAGALVDELRAKANAVRVANANRLQALEATLDAERKAREEAEHFQRAAEAGEARAEAERDTLRAEVERLREEVAGLLAQADADAFILTQAAEANAKHWDGVRDESTPPEMTADQVVEWVCAWVGTQEAGTPDALRAAWAEHKSKGGGS